MNARHSHCSRRLNPGSTRYHASGASRCTSTSTTSSQLPEQVPGRHDSPPPALHNKPRATFRSQAQQTNHRILSRAVSLPEVRRQQVASLILATPAFRRAALHCAASRGGGCARHATDRRLSHPACFSSGVACKMSFVDDAAPPPQQPT